MDKIKTEVYEKYYYLTKKFLYSRKINPVEFEDYKAFLDEKFCETVHRYYSQKIRLTTLQNYLSASLQVADIEFIKDKIKDRKILTMNTETLDTYMIEDKHCKLPENSPLYEGLEPREISFLILSIYLSYQTIAQSYQCATKTVQRVLQTARQKLRINAQKLGYRI